MAKSIDKDLPLKLQFRSILFSQGYWTPLEVELSNFESLGTGIRRKSLTDLDVLGIKFDAMFNRSCVVGDCKSGKNVSDANRLFWLRGVRDYFGADVAYYLRPKVDSHVAAIAPKMGLCTLTSEKLSEIEVRLRCSEESKALGDIDSYSAMIQLWGIDVAKGAKPTEDQLRRKRVYSFLSYNYWYLERFRVPMQLVGVFEEVAELLDPDDDRDVLLAYVGAERFALCLLDVAAYIHSHGESSIPHQARSYLYGGPIGLREKERIFELMGKLGVTGESLDPPWLQDTIELLGRIIANPLGASDVLRHLAVAYTACVVKCDPSLLTLGRALNTDSIVLAKDITFQFAKSTGIRKALFKAIEQI